MEGKELDGRKGTRSKERNSMEGRILEKEKSNSSGF